MNKQAARKLARYYNFRKIELHEMMVKLLDMYPENYYYWQKPNYTNPIFDNGYFFNQCIKWLDYKKGINDNEVCKEMVTFRILQCAGKFSKIQIPKKKKYIPNNVASEKPTL